MRTLPITAVLAVLASAPAIAQPPATTSPTTSTKTVTQDTEDDPFIWLEDAESPRAIDWARAENARSLKVLENDPRYATLHAEALKIVDAVDRIPTPSFRGGAIYNLWQDAEHAQGLWRRTTLDSYQTASPAWQAVLDLDALSKAEGKTWVWHGVTCLKPEDRRCIVALSDGGEDAETLREFDLTTKAFVDGGFDLPRGKQNAVWLDADTLVVDREWGPGTMTESGYPFVVKTLKRGQPLDQAQEIFRGEPTDVAVEMAQLYDPQTGRSAVLLVRGVTFFESEIHLVAPDGVKRLVPPKKVTVRGFLGGRLIFTIEQDWTPDGGGTTFPQGSLLAGDLDRLAAGDAGGVRVIYAPGPRESIESVGVSKSKVVVSAYQNVRGRAFVFTPAADGSWTRGQVPFPDNLSVDLVDVDDASDRAFVETASFLQPTELALVDAGALAAKTVKALPARFDASKDVTEQFEATSTDGTKVPYFVVRPKGLKFDGIAPTLLYAYGGFQISMTPSYSANIGKLWLERGGVFVLANIRGGGEVGPAWHEAGLKTHRQRIYNDFAAVAKDLIARKITSPRRLGIEGGSNGGLLMGVEMEQHPDLWNAAVIQVPLLDLIRMPKIGAGASWVGEYGSPDVPEERAFLETISPYQNLKPDVKYPEPFLVTSTKDDRVGPGHARKFAARMESMGLPFLYYENIEGGHSAAANLHETAHRVSLEMTYLTRKLMD